MGNKICIVRNDTDQKIRMKIWNDGYITETKGNAIYRDAEAEQVVEAGKFTAVDVTDLENLWELKQRICEEVSIYISYRVYEGSSTDHSETLEVAELLINGGIVFYKAPDKDQLKKHWVPRAQLDSGLEQRRRAAAAAATRSGCCLLPNPRFLHFPRTKKLRIQEMNEEIMSNWGSSVASTATYSCVHEDTGDNQGPCSMAGDNSEAECESGSANLMLILLNKTGTDCLFSGKEPHECSPIHMGKTEFASGVATNDCFMLGYLPPLRFTKNCTNDNEMEKENPIMGADGNSIVDYNSGHCNNKESQGNPHTTAGT